MKNDWNDRRRSMHCPRCGKLISIGSDRCINCGLPRPRLFLSTPILGDLIRESLHLADNIVLACFVLYGLSLVLDMGGISLGGGLLNMLSPTQESLYKLGMGGLGPWLTGRWWTLVTAIYLHGGILHIGFNMLWLRRIGPLVEELFGVSRFWIIYTLAGLLGAVLTTFLGTYFFVGASGAIFGLFGALIYYGRHRGGTFGSGIFREMLIWAVIGLALSFVVPGIDIWGHIGGFVSGFLLAVVLGYQEKGRQTLNHHILAAALLVFVALCFLMMVINFFL